MTPNLPAGVVQFMAVGMVMGLQGIVGGWIFAHVISQGPGHVISPVHPKGELARSGSLWVFLRRVCGLRDDEVLKNGGADGLLALKRVEHRCAMVLANLFMAVPLLIAYAVNLEGGATALGLARTTIANAAPLSVGRLHIRLWAMVAACYFVQIAGNLILERYDELASKIISASVEKAPGHHYAVVARGLDPANVKDIFETALRGSVLHVHHVTAYNNRSAAAAAAACSREREIESAPPFLWIRDDDAACFPQIWGSLVAYVVRRWRHRRGGLRGRVHAYVEALRAAKQREADARPDALGARPYAERCRVALADAVAAPRQLSRVAVVVFDSVSSATAAATLPVGLVGGDDRSLDPAPEPRDIKWENLEEGSSRDAARAWGIVGITLAATAGFSGVALATRIYARRGPENVVALAVMGVVPVYVAKRMMGATHAALRWVYWATNEASTESRLELSTQRDYVRLLQACAFAGPILAIALFSTVPKHHRSMLDRSGDGAAALDYVPPDFLQVLAIRKIPPLAFGFAAMLLFKTGDDLYSLLFRVPAYVHYLKMKRAVLRRGGESSRVFANQFYFGQGRDRDPTHTIVGAFAFSGQAGFEVFALSIVSAFAPLAPAVVPVGLLYLTVATFSQKFVLSNTACPKFNVDGLFWRLDVRQSRSCLHLALAFNLIICLFCGAVAHLFGLAPLLVLAVYFDAKSAHRFLTKNRHGLSAGRLPLLEAADVDRRRAPTHAATACADYCGADQVWAPREEPPPRGGDVDFFPGPPIADDDDLDDRLEPLLMWLARYDSKRAVPTFFRTPEGTEDVVFKDSTLRKIADTVWRKMKTTYPGVAGHRLHQQLPVGDHDDQAPADVVTTRRVRLGTNPDDDDDDDDDDDEHKDVSHQNHPAPYAP